MYCWIKDSKPNSFIPDEKMPPFDYLFNLYRRARSYIGIYVQQKHYLLCSLVSQQSTVFIQLAAGSDWPWFELMAPLLACFIIIVLCIHAVVRDDLENSLLHFACWGGHMKVILYLIEEMKCDVGEYSCLSRCDS